MMIEGLKIIEDYISETEEIELLNKIKLPLRKFYDSKRNIILRYGSNIPYNSHIKSKDIPDYLIDLAKKLVDDKMLSEIPDSITINQYKFGQIIPYHKDSAESGDVITVLSLLGDANMGMRLGKLEYVQNIKRRTLVQMTGVSRWEWEHCIFPVKTERISIVFRKGTPQKK